MAHDGIGVKDRGANPKPSGKMTYNQGVFFLVEILPLKLVENKA